MFKWTLHVRPFSCYEDHDFIMPDLWLPSSPDLNPVGYSLQDSELCRNMFIGNQCETLMI